MLKKVPENLTFFDFIDIIEYLIYLYQNKKWQDDLVMNRHIKDLI